jgi:hypothetical protein
LQIFFPEEMLLHLTALAAHEVSARRQSPTLSATVLRYAETRRQFAKPADLPAEQPMKVEPVVNLKTAKQIGVNIDPNLLARATRIVK